MGTWFSKKQDALMVGRVNDTDNTCVVVAAYTREFTLITFERREEKIYLLCSPKEMALLRGVCKATKKDIEPMIEELWTRLKRDTFSLCEDPALLHPAVLVEQLHIMSVEQVFLIGGTSEEEPFSNKCVIVQSTCTSSGTNKKGVVDFLRFLPTLETPRRFHAACFLQGLFFVFAGEMLSTSSKTKGKAKAKGKAKGKGKGKDKAKSDTEGTAKQQAFVDSIEVCDVIAGDGFKTLTAIKTPPGLADCACASLGSCIYLVGGTIEYEANESSVSRYEDSNAILCYELQSSSADASSSSSKVPVQLSLRVVDLGEEARLASPRYGCAAVAFKGKLWMAGGLSDTTRLRSVETYDPTTRQTWTEGQLMCQGRAYFSLLVGPDGALYAVGK